jgi:hypothetical protein
MRVEALLFDDRPGRDDADDLPLHEAAAARLLALLADRDGVAGREQSCDVRLARVRGEPAQRRFVRLAAVPRRERQVADARRRDGVVEEHLVEVAEPEEQNGGLMLRLDAEVLLEQRASHTRFFFFAR